jgi:DNA-binding transcriptional LysR family regulator
MELRHLRYFVVLAEELNFGRAAARLHISQPPLTRQIQQLEEKIGACLFLRTTRGVELTTAGKTLLEEAQRILGMVKVATERTGKAARGQIGRLDVGIFGSAILNHIPRLLLEFRNHYPEVEIALYPMTKAEQLEALRAHQITVGFNRHVPKEADIVVETVYFEPLVIALNRKHPLAQQKSIRIADIVDQPLIVYPRNTRTSFAQDVLSLIHEEGGVPQVVQEVADVVTAIALVASGFGICVTPQAASSLKLPGVVYRQIKAEQPPSIELACLYRQDDQSPILAAFLDIVRKLLPDNPLEAKS